MSESPPTDNPIDLEMEMLKIDSESKPKEFSDLTTDVLKVIIDELELKERLTLRKVSGGLRALVDQQKSILRVIDVECHVNHILFKFNTYKIVYVKANVVSWQFWRSDFYQDAKVITSEDYLKMALEDLESAINYPSLHLDRLCVTFVPTILGKKAYEYVENFSKNFEAILWSLGQKLSTKNFELHADELSKPANRVLEILPHLKPGDLRRIRTTGILPRIEQIAELEQWKQLEELCTCEVSRDMFDEKHISHFKRLEFKEDILSFTYLFRLRIIMSASDSLDYCLIRPIHGSFQEMEFEHIMDRLGKPTVPPKSNLRHHQISGTNKYLEIELGADLKSLTITKLTR